MLQMFKEMQVMLHTVQKEYQKKVPAGIRNL